MESFLWSTNNDGYGYLFENTYGSCGHYCCSYGFDNQHYDENHPIMEGFDGVVEINEFHLMNVGDPEAEIVFAVEGIVMDMTTQ